MDDEKVLMKKDLALILEIDSKMNYNDIENVKKIHDAVIERDMLHTAIGTRYIKKLEQIIKETSTDKCIFCGKQIDNPSKTVLCTDCTAKFIKPTLPKEQSNTSNATVKDEAKPVKFEKKQDDTASTTPPKANGKKRIIVGAIIIVLVLGILSAIGFGRVFTVLMMVSLVYLVYVCIKKKPKRNAIILFTILFVLTGITNMENANSDSADFVNNNVDVDSFLSAYQNTMNVSAKDLSNEEFTVQFDFYLEKENRITYTINILDSSCASIQFVCDNKKIIKSILGYSYMNNSLGAFIMINLIQTIHPNLSYDEAEKLIADSQIKNIGDKYNVIDNYGYAYFNDSDGLTLMITSKKEAINENMQIDANF